MNSSSREVLIIDIRGVIARDESTILRHIDYGKYLAQISHGNTSLVVISRGNSTLINKLVTAYDAPRKFIIEERSRFNLLHFTFLCLRYVRENTSRISLLVSGDPWETYWFCRFLSLLAGDHLKIQVQLHADILDPNWRQLSAANRIRFHLLRLNSKSIHNVRLVSASQRANILNRFPYLVSRITVAPVPLSISPYTRRADLKLPNKLVIGFVGRIHKDRGLILFVNVINRLEQDGWRGRVLVVGEGPEANSFRKNLEDIVGTSRVTFTGVKSGGELRKFWEEIDVLLNTAPTESYGRSTREALYYGKVVMSLETNGISELRSERDSGQLVVIDPTEPESWINELRKLAGFKAQESYSKRVWEQNEQDMMNVIRSWE